MKFIRGILDRIILVAVVIAAGCIPSFIAQYRQRLGGQLDQVLLDLAPFQLIANQFHHGSLKELIKHHLASDDATFYKEGAALQAMLDAVTSLSQSLQALDADLIHQFIYILNHAEPQILAATWQNYAPSFNLGVESVTFAIVAGFVVWLLFILIWNVVARLFMLVAAR